MSVDNDLFGTDNIFANRELVTIGHVPELDRVVGRDEEIKKVGKALGPATRGGPARNVLIYGKTGSGKSLVSRCVTRGAKRKAENNEQTMEYCYVDCSDYPTETKASRELAKSLRARLDLYDEVNIPHTGLPASSYNDMVWDMLNQHDISSFVVILDEIDMLDSTDLIRSLSRAKESGKTDTHIGMVCVSNKITYKDTLDERTNSSFQATELVFDSYDAQQLKNILFAREDAFKEGALEDGVIPLTAAKSAQTHGDARKAVDTLYEAGKLAEDQNAELVTEEHVREAMDKAEVNRLQQLISGQPEQAKRVLRALAALSIEQDEDWFRTSHLHSAYTDIVESHGGEPRTTRQVGRHLDELAFLEITEGRHTGGGRARGTYVEHRLLAEPEKVLEALDDDDE